MPLLIGLGLGLGSCSVVVLTGLLLRRIGRATLLEDILLLALVGSKDDLATSLGIVRVESVEEGEEAFTTPTNGLLLLLGGSFALTKGVEGA